MTLAMALSQAAPLLEAEVLGADARFTGAGLDTRTLRPGELFLALRGRNTDGHELLAAAERAGAAAAVIERPVAAPLPRLLVADVRAAMARLAGHWRARFDLPVVAVTGSNGKTTCKEMVAAILGQDRRVLATEGNLNNELGVPLTLFRLGSEHAAAVVEIGANHPGEVAALGGIVKPRVALVTCCAPAHVEGFGSVAGVAQAKGELYASLGADGRAVVNADDAYAGLWRRLAANRPVTSFGFAADADVRVIDRGAATPAGGRAFTVITPAGTADMALPLPGRHNLANAAASIAVALALGIDLAQCRAGLAGQGAAAGRLQIRRGRGGARILDDSYNANPGALAAALEVLAEQGGTRWLVLGQMAELGADSERYHAEAGARARSLGIEHLLAVGPVAGRAAAAGGAGGEQVADNEAAVERLRAACGPGTSVLVKGSRSAATEAIVAALAAEDEPC